jgi:tetratricopeptide (TPR) repeat protein
MKCARCGLESDLEQAFTVRKRWAGLASAAYCPECIGGQEARDQLVSAVMLALFLLLLDSLTLRRGPARLLADLAFLAAVNIPIVVLHELAHACAGRVLGVHVFRVIIGSGKLLVTRRAFGITWEWRLWPFSGGTVMACPPQAGNRARFFGAVLAGPALHAFLLGAAAAFQMFLLILQEWFGLDLALLLQWTGLFLVFDLILLLFNLLPRRARGSAGQIGSDGLQLLNLLFMKPEDEQLRAQSFYLIGAVEAFRRGEADEALRWAGQGLERYPDQPALRTVRGEALIQKKRFAEARAVFADLLSSEGGKSLLIQSLMQSNIAYTDVLLRDPDLLPEADRFSMQALRRLPWEPAIAGTRGAVLLELGRLDEGIELLEKALAGQKTNSGKAADAFHIADGEARRGNTERSRRYRELAHKYDPNLFLLQGNGEKSQRRIPRPPTRGCQNRINRSGRPQGSSRCF